MKLRINRIRVAPEPLCFGIGLYQRHDLITSSEFQITQCFSIDREYAAGRAVLWRHIGERGAIRQ